MITTTIAHYQITTQLGQGRMGILQRQQQTELLEHANTESDPNRFIEVAMFQSPPMTRQLSGLEVEYSIALTCSSEVGKRETTIGFNIGQGTQDIGFPATF